MNYRSTRRQLLRKHLVVRRQLFEVTASLFDNLAGSCENLAIKMVGNELLIQRPDPISGAFDVEGDILIKMLGAKSALAGPVLSLSVRRTR